MNYPSITIQGSIISGEIISQIRAEQQKFQTGKDFGFENNQQLKDEIVLAWSDLKNQWKIFASKRTRLKDDDSGASETRTFWMDPFFANLGYKLEKANAEVVEGGKPFNINRRDFELDGFPVFIGAWNEKLDRKPASLRMSPHALVQEYLNVSEHLYALVTNGRQLRLLRDATLLSRTSCVEFNLEKIFEEDLFADFSLLYRLLHSTRMPKNKESVSECILEHYHSESLASGSRIRENLSKAVKDAIKLLGNGFLKHPKNSDFREKVKKGEINEQLFYHHQLRIIYRLLFLFVIEEKNLVFANGNTPETKKQSDIYRNYYSLYRLRKLAGRLHLPDMRNHYDLWYSMLSTFSFYENTATGKKLGIMALNGELFGSHTLSCTKYNLKDLYLDNSTLLSVMRNLCYFENEQKLLIPVNYRDLDVEEFGSVYEGLLELEPTFDTNTEQLQFYFTESSERSKSGSHYTPEELVQPLIKHSLEYIIEDKLKEKDKEAALLSIKVCDVACGSGHILLSAARRISLELAKVRSGEEQPNLDALRKGMRDVIRHCIYGVDKNPLAVELCKVALWLEAHNPGEPLNFLDHHIKCGDAIVGLAHREELENGIADEAFKTLPGDEKEVATVFSKQNKTERKQRDSKALQINTNFEASTTANVQEAMEEYKTFNQLPETTPEEIATKQNAYKRFLDGKGFTFLKTMADTQIAQFFIPKTNANKDKLISDNEYRQILSGQKGWQGQKTAKATAIAQEERFFHWFLEFPEVFQKNGFDCILGNPPYLGGKKISGAYGDYYLNTLINSYSNTGGLSDLIVYFTRRIFDIVTDNSYLSIISTNSLYQGDSRIGGLETIIKNKGLINFGVRSIKWPGKAQTYVVLISIKKGVRTKEKIVLDGKDVNYISSFLDTAEEVKIFELKQNAQKSFIGSVVNGQGFVLETKAERDNLIKSDEKCSEVIFSYLNGSDFNNDINFKPSRYIINVFDWPIDRVKEYPVVYKHLLDTVYPERMKKKDKGYRDRWWQYARQGKDLYEAIKNNSLVLVRTQASKHNFIDFVENGYVYDQKLVVFKDEGFVEYSFLNSTIHDIWAGKFSGDFGGIPNYSPSRIYETFPFIRNKSDKELKNIHSIGEKYFHKRRNVLNMVKEGLTQTYNLFHAQFLTSVDIEKATKQTKEVSEQALKEISELRLLHKQMDETVIEAYGWNDIQLKHDFYEVDYLPENDRVRYTLSPEARKEVLKRLLELNHTIYEKEIKEGLHKEEDVIKFYDQKGIPIPQEVQLIMASTKKDKKVKAYKKTKDKSTAVNEDANPYLQTDLFEVPNLFNGENIMKEFSLTDGIYTIRDTVEITGLTDAKVRGWFKELSKENYEGLGGQSQSDIDKLRISFHGLIEMVVIGTLRDNGYSLKKILKARTDLSTKTNKIYPFATNNVKDKLHVAGSDIVFEFADGSKVTLDGKGQINIDFITLFFKDIEFNVDGVAQRLIPTKGKGKIAIDPKEGNGKPVIKDKDIQVEIIKRFYSSLESIDDILEQYPTLNKEEVLAAVEYN